MRSVFPILGYVSCSLLCLPCRTFGASLYCFLLHGLEFSSTLPPANPVNPRVTHGAVRVATSSSGLSCFNVLYCFKCHQWRINHLIEIQVRCTVYWSLFLNMELLFFIVTWTLFAVAQCLFDPCHLHTDRIQHSLGFLLNLRDRQQTLTHLDSLTEDRLIVDISCHHQNFNTQDKLLSAETV